jgi:hypothetical protein
VAQNKSPTKTGKRRRSAIDGRTTRHGSYDQSQKRRKCRILDLIHRTASDFAIHPTSSIISEAESSVSRTRAALAPAKPVLRILDRINPLTELAAMR